MHLDNSKPKQGDRDVKKDGGSWEVREPNSSGRL